MREELQLINEWRGTFRAKFERYGFKRKNKILLKDVIFMDEKKMVTDHIWMNATLGMQELGEIQQGQILEFKARVKKYRKGSITRNIPVSFDYELTRPTQWKFISAIDEVFLLLQIYLKKQLGKMC